ncbi:hypothetical protein R6Q59_006446 [Mikania micrantha]
MMNETNPTGSQAASSAEDKLLIHQQQQQQEEIFIQVPNDPFRNRRSLPNFSLFQGDRKDYLEVGVPLYKASIKCDWKEAERILDKKPELVRYSITENGETALHVSASVKRSKHVEKFVKNLMERMNLEDLELVNKNSNTALYLAAASGNIKTVRIMLQKNKALNVIAGGSGTMPVYMAALCGNHEVVKYLYQNSNGLGDDYWNPTNRGWLLEKCVEADMFDVALEIVTRYPSLGSGAVLGYLARKPNVFSETKSGFIRRNIHSVFGLNAGGAYGKENAALKLLKIVWKDISRRPRREIDDILRGPSDLINQGQELTAENVVRALQLEKLIYEHCDKLKTEFNNINAIKQDEKSTSRHHDQAQQLLEIVSKHLVNMHVETRSMLTMQDNSGDQVMDLKNLIFKHIVSMHEETQKARDQAQQLQAVIFKNIEKMRRETAKIALPYALGRKTYSSRVLFVAAEMGNTKFLVELIRQYPDLMWKVNDSGESIFHIAVKNRHEGIYNMLYEIGSAKDLITPLRDKSDNNLLHLAGKNASKDRLADVSGPALQMQRELLWFKEVRNMIPPMYRERKNKQGRTPYEIFTEEHKDLVTQGEKWMKGMASQCMVVATLVATIVFAAAFTVPGGYNQNDGIPIFYQKSVFIVFVVADAISLFLSSASILTFLSLLTSRYAEHDFMESLPRKLMLGLVSLFLSITAMMVTFSVSFFILYHKEMKWVPMLISVSAVMPVLLYVLLQHNLLIDVLRSSFGSKYLFKPRKQFLF